jgi:hypothetical protein
MATARTGILGTALRWVLCLTWAALQSAADALDKLITKIEHRDFTPK